MSNLGMYQMITTVSKRVGGPVKFLLLVAVGGYFTGRTIEWAGKKVVNAVKEGGKEEQVYTVKTDYAIGGDEKTYCEFAAGDQYQILARDGDVVLINKLGDKNSPYYVTDSFLKEITL